MENHTQLAPEWSPVIIAFAALGLTALGALPFLTVVMWRQRRLIRRLVDNEIQRHGT